MIMVRSVCREQKATRPPGWDTPSPGRGTITANDAGTPEIPVQRLLEAPSRPAREQRRNNNDDDDDDDNNNNILVADAPQLSSAQLCPLATDCCDASEHPQPEHDTWALADPAKGRVGHSVQASSFMLIHVGKSITLLLLCFADRWSDTDGSLLQSASW
jgi:hypothetical protein